MKKYRKLRFNTGSPYSLDKINYENLKLGDVIELWNGDVVRVARKDDCRKCCRECGVRYSEKNHVLMPTYSHCHLLQFLDEVWEDWGDYSKFCEVDCGPYIFEYVTKIIRN